ncbi:MAG: Piwi domain-containing protein, partial [Thermoplasmata archaeon]
ENEKKFAPYHLYIINKETEWGKKAIRLEPYYLKEKKLFGFLIDYKFLKNPDVPFNKRIQQLSFSLDENYKSNTNYHIDKYRYLSEFIKIYPEIFSINNEFQISKEFQNIEYRSLKLRKYIFGRNNEDNSQFQGINNYGPYEWEDKSINYVYIFHKNDKDYVNNFIKALNGEKFRTFTGLNKIGLPLQNTNNTRGIPINSFEENLESIINNNIDKNSVIIAVFPSKEEKFYFTLKSICLERDIPLQTVHLETIVDENKLKWSVSSIALQILAKLGGIPWIVRTVNQDSLIIGIGQSIERYKDKTIRFFAYSVLLDSSGRFLTIEPLADATDKKQYLEILGSKVSELIQQYQKYSKIVFHVPEKISKKTIKKIENALKLVNSNTELYIVRVNDDSKFFGYDLNNNSLIPFESSYIQLSSREYLLWTEGLNYHNPTPRKKYSNPIYIDFYYSNQGKIDYEKLLQDILNLSGTNYRGFNAKSLPVSMFYPKLISQFYKYFNKYNISSNIEKRNRMWFL